MSDAPQDSPSPGIFERIGNFFRGGPKSDIIDPGTGLANTTHSSLLRPWAKRDHAIDQMSQGFSTLTDLMAGIREGPRRPEQAAG